MAWYNDYFPRSLTKAERREQAAKMAAKITKKKGRQLSPVEVEGIKIAKTFWGKAWCDNIESYEDEDHRLARGRSYVRSGSVIDLVLEPGNITALVAGSASKPYIVEIKVAPLSASQKAHIRSACAAHALSTLDLLQGKMPQPLLEMFRSGPDGIFPTRKELVMNCSCPDWSCPCKHQAAVLYGVGHRLDEKPELLFSLRGLELEELAAGAAAADLAAPGASELPGADLASLFGIELAPPDAVPAGMPVKRKAAPTPEKTPKAPATRKKAAAKTPSLPKMLMYICKYTRWGNEELAKNLGVTDGILDTLLLAPSSASARNLAKVQKLYKEVERIVQEAKAAKKSRDGKK